MSGAMTSCRDALAWRWHYWRQQFGVGVLGRTPWFPTVFPSIRDMRAYTTAVLAMNRIAEPVVIHVRDLKNTQLLCRPGASDPWVLWDVFYCRYHLPPPEVQPENGWIIDLGANVGYTGSHFAGLFPKARILSVEMDPANAAMASRNLASFGSRVRLVNAAVWHEDGQVVYNGADDQSFQIASLQEASTGGDTKTVPARSLDSLFAEYQVDTIDYLKMDIEGAEATVLRPPMEWAKRVRALKVEVHPPATMEGCRNALQTLGFRVANDRVHPRCLVGIR